MANWRKQQGESHHHQVVHWRSSSYSRKPPLHNWHLSVPAWEKKFCATIGSVPWRKLVDSKKYMHLFDNVVSWNDSAGKEAFDNAKMKYWAEISSLPCNISLPDPDMYIDEVDWNATVDPELMLDLEREEMVPVEEQKNEVVMIGSTLYLNEKPLPCTGWGDDEAEAPKAFDLNAAVQGWGSNVHESNGVGSGQQYGAPVEHAREYEWQDCGNDSWGWNNHRERHYYGGNSGGGGGDLHKMGTGSGRGRSGSYANWGAWHVGSNKKSMPWTNTSPAYNGNNENHMNRGRRNNRGGGGGGRRGNFVYVPKEVPTPAAS